MMIRQYTVSAPLRCCRLSSAEEAGEMCNSLKAAGGQCIVLRN